MLCELSLGLLTLWLLLQEGIICLIGDINYYTYKKRLRIVSAIVKVILSIAFVFGVHSKMESNKQENQLHQTLLQQLENLGTK